MRAAILVVVLTTCACGGSAQTAESTTPAASADEAGPRQAITDQTRQEFQRYRSEHESAWQRRLQLAEGLDAIDQLQPRFLEASTHFSQEAQAAQTGLDQADQALRQQAWDAWSQHVNEARTHVQVMRRMVEDIQREVHSLEPESAAGSSGEGNNAAQGAEAPHTEGPAKRVTARPPH